MSATEDHLKIARSEPAEIVLHGSIVAGPERRYAVTLRPGNGHRLKEPDYLRFALHYYAHVLYHLMVGTERTVRDLPELVERVAGGALGGGNDVFELAGVDGAMLLAVPQPIGRIDLAFRRVGYREFDFDGEFALKGRPLAYSVLAVLQSVSSQITEQGVGALFAALANMNVSYTVTHAYRDPKSCREVPVIAFNAAAFI